MTSSIALVAALAAALLLSSCSGPASPDHPASSTAAAASDSPAPNNAADVTFVTDMIPHHQQAVLMSGLVPQRSTDPAVIKLAADISAAQAPEIQTMKALLVQWNSGTDDGQGAPQGGMDGMKMQGMVDDATMARLTSLTGHEFDTLWLTSMIGHHEGAIAMANTEIANGANADAKTLAAQIVASQQPEIDMMEKMGLMTNGG